MMRYSKILSIIIFSNIWDIIAWICSILQFVVYHVPFQNASLIIKLKARLHASLFIGGLLEFLMVCLCIPPVFGGMFSRYLLVLSPALKNDFRIEGLNV